MARPRSEDKKQALLDAATDAVALQGIAASTALIARNAGVAEGTLFRYFPTKDDLLNALYLHLKTLLCEALQAGLKDMSTPKTIARDVWNSYISWGLKNTLAQRAVRRMSVSEKITPETRQRVNELFPELYKLCQRAMRQELMTIEFEDFGDALFLALAETTIEFALRHPTRSQELIALGFESMWRALAQENPA